MRWFVIMGTFVLSNMITTLIIVPLDDSYSYDFGAVENKSADKMPTSKAEEVSMNDTCRIKLTRFRLKYN